MRYILGIRCVIVYVYRETAVRLLFVWFDRGCLAHLAPSLQGCDHATPQRTQELYPDTCPPRATHPNTKRSKPVTSMPEQQLSHGKKKSHA